jgi:hypothetical protein
VAGDFHEGLPHELRVGDDHVCADGDVIHARGVGRVVYTGNGWSP